MAKKNTKKTPAQKADKAARKAMLAERIHAAHKSTRTSKALANAVIQGATVAATHAVVSAIRGTNVKPAELRSSDLKAVGAAVAKAAALSKEPTTVKEETFKDFIFKRVAQGQPTKKIADAILETFGKGGPREDYKPGMTPARAMNHARWYRSAAVREGVISETRSRVTSRD